MSRRPTLAPEGCEVKVRSPQTIGERLDDQIAQARKQVERLCIVKAKAEAAQLLDYPTEFIEQLSGYPF